MSTILDAYQENIGGLRRFLRRFLTRREDIEDLVQEAFLRAYAAESTQTINNPKAFLFTTARNLALNEKMRLSNMMSEPLRDMAGKTVLGIRGQLSPDDELDARQRAHLLAQAMASLPPRCFRVMMLRMVDGLSQKEIALRLNISVKTVEKHVTLGLSRSSEYLRMNGCDVPARTGEARKEPTASKTPLHHAVSYLRDAKKPNLR